MRKEDFSNKYFSGGGEQLQAKLQSYSKRPKTDLVI